MIKENDDKIINRTIRNDDCCKWI